MAINNSCLLPYVQIELNPNYGPWVYLAEAGNG